MAIVGTATPQDLMSLAHARVLAGKMDSAIELAEQAVNELLREMTSKGIYTPSDTLEFAQTAALTAYWTMQRHSQLNGPSLMKRLRASYFHEIAAAAYGLAGKPNQAMSERDAGRSRVSEVETYAPGLPRHERSQVEAALLARQIHVGTINGGRQQPGRWWGAPQTSLIPSRAVNCQRVVIATVGTLLSRAFIDAPARNNINDASDHRDRLEAAREWAYGAPTQRGTLRELVEQLREAGNGATGILGYSWPEGGGGGHATVLHNRNGFVFMVEGQTGEMPVEVNDSIPGVPTARNFSLIMASDPRRPSLPIDHANVAQELLRKMDLPQFCGEEPVNVLELFGPAPAAVTRAVTEELANRSDAPARSEENARRAAAGFVAVYDRQAGNMFKMLARDLGARDLGRDTRVSDGDSALAVCGDGNFALIQGVGGWEATTDLTTGRMTIGRPPVVRKLFDLSFMRSLPPHVAQALDNLGHGAAQGRSAAD